MKTVFSLASAFLLAVPTAMQAGPVLDVHSGSDVVVASSHTRAAPDGGTYISGISRPALGVSAPAQPHIHIIAYDRNGDILLEKIDILNRSDFITSHYAPSPRAAYTAYLPVEASKIGKVTIIPHSGHHHGKAKI